MKSKIPLTKDEPDINLELTRFIEKYDRDIDVRDDEEGCVTYTFKNNEGDTLGLEFFFNSRTFGIQGLDLYLNGIYAGMVAEDEAQNELYELITEKIRHISQEQERQRNQKLRDNLLNFLRS